MLHEQRVIAIAADYADALLVARTAKRLLTLLLVLVVLIHLALFFTAHFSPDTLNRAVGSATQPATATAADFLRFITAATLFGSVILNVLLVLVLFLTIHIMLVGRLVGVRDVTRSLVASFVLLLLMIPWQTLLVTQSLGSSDAVIPGALFTWREVSERVIPHVSMDTMHQVLYWARFVAFPLFALFLLLRIQVLSGRGLKYALGEETVVTETPVVAA